MTSFSRSIALAAPLSVAAACIAIPPFEEVSAACGVPRGFDPGLPFPPAGRELRLRAGLVADVNRDGISDLVVASTTFDPDDRGIYVLLGPQDPAQPLAYHAFLPTSGILPEAIAVEDIMGSGCDDIVFFGLDPAPANRGSRWGIFEYAGTGPGQLYDTTVRAFGRAAFATNELDPEQPDLTAPKPVSVAVGDFDGLGGKDDIVVADLHEMHMFTTTDPRGTYGLPTRIEGHQDAIQGLFVLQEPAGDDLLVVHASSVQSLTSDQGAFDPQPPTGDASPTSLAFALAELSGNGKRYVIGANASDNGVVYLVDRDRPPTIAIAKWQGEAPGPIPSSVSQGQVWSLAVDRDGRLFVLEFSPATRLYLVEMLDLSAAPGEVTSSAPLAANVAVGEVALLLVLDFESAGGGQEVALVLGRDGSSQCFRDLGATFGPC